MLKSWNRNNTFEEFIQRRIVSWQVMRVTLVYEIWSCLAFLPLSAAFLGLGSG